MPWSKHTRDDAPSWHDEPSSPAAEHVAHDRRWTIFVRGSGWFDVDAETAEEAGTVAEELLAFGNNPVEEWLSIEVDEIQEDTNHPGGSESPQEATGDRD